MTDIPSLDIIIPVAIELDWPTVDSTLRDIREQHTRYGFTKFALAAPCGGWRCAGFPDLARWQSLAEFFAQVRDALAPEGIQCGWWITATLKSGRREDFTAVTKADGSTHPFSNCPLDDSFSAAFAQSVAAFAAIAKPAFIFTEDDYSVVAAGTSGCFCEKHLRLFSRQEGKCYTREALAEALTKDSALQLRWASFNGEGLISLAKQVRTALDLETPEIPMGTMQPGGDDREGFCNEAVARAFAGPRHTPFSRICGAFYSCMETKKIPRQVFHALYSKQHYAQPFRFYHESDTYPHTRYFISAAQMRAFFGTVYSYGFDGSTFQTQQLLDDPNEEKVHGDMFRRERRRFEAIHQAAKQCDVVGAELPYDPAYALTAKKGPSAWLNTLFHYGIPYTTTAAKTAFWDGRQASLATDAEIKSALSACLFLDGDAAKILSDRGFSAEIGVTVGDEIALGDQANDLGEREVIRDAYCSGKGHNMPSAHMYSPKNCGNGTARVLIPVSDACEILTDAYDFRRNRLAATMTRFVNAMGGHVIVQSLSVYGNDSHAQLNYRRQRLIHEGLLWGGDEIAFVRENAEVFTVQNQAKNPAESGFTGLLTLIDYCEDGTDTVTLHLPKAWSQVKTVCRLAQDGTWQPADCTLQGQELTLHSPLAYLDPCYLMLN